MGYGKAKYGSDQKFQKTGKPGKGPGDNYIRIMPPMHSFADEGKWAVYYTTHWGYAGVSKSDPTKTTVRPFRCIEDKDRRTQMLRQVCPECENFRAKEKEANAFEAKLKAQGLDDKAIKANPEMKAYSDWLQSHAPERKWYVNVMYKDRTFGDYKINHKTHKKGIDAKIAELMDNQQIDALDPDQGVFFNIKRLGDGFTVPDVIEVGMKMEEATINGRLQKIPVVELAPLSADEAARGLKECRDLATLGGTLLTEQQIYALVNSDGSPEAVDKVFGERPAAASRPIQNEDREEDVTEDAGPAPASSAGPTITEEMKARAASILAKKAEADKAAAKEAAKAAAEAAAKRAAAAVAAAKAAESAAPPAPAPTSAVGDGSAPNPLDMNDADFLAFFNQSQPAQ